MCLKITSRILMKWVKINIFSNEKAISLGSEIEKSLLRDS